jgi:hypothetical protein
MVNHILEQLETVSRRLDGVIEKLPPSAVGYLRQKVASVINTMSGTVPAMFTAFEPSLLISKNVTMDMSNQAFRINIAGLYRVSMSTWLQQSLVTTPVFYFVSIRRDTTEISKTYRPVSAQDSLVHFQETSFVELPVGCVLTLWIQNSSATAVRTVHSNTTMSVELVN